MSSIGKTGYIARQNVDTGDRTSENQKTKMETEKIGNVSEFSFNAEKLIKVKFNLRYFC